MNDIRQRIIGDHMRCVLSHAEVPINYDLVQRVIDALYCKHGSHTDLADQLERLADDFRQKLEECEVNQKELLDRIADSLTDPEDLYMTRGNAAAK